MHSGYITITDEEDYTEYIDNNQNIKILSNEQVLTDKNNTNTIEIIENENIEKSYYIKIPYIEIFAKSIEKSKRLIYFNFN